MRTLIHELASSTSQEANNLAQQETSLAMRYASAAFVWPCAAEYFEYKSRNLFARFEKTGKTLYESFAVAYDLLSITAANQADKDRIEEERALFFRFDALALSAIANVVAEATESKKPLLFIAPEYKPKSPKIHNTLVKKQKKRPTGKIGHHMGQTFRR